MNTQISNLLKQFSNYSKKELLLLEQALEYKTLKKGEFLLDKGAICSSLSFLNSGALYQYTVDTNLDKHIIELYTANDWVINNKSFSSRSKSDTYIQAFEDSSICFLTIDAIHNLIAQSQSFFQIGRILDDSTSRIHFFDENLTPDKKYAYLLENKPKLLQAFPQKLIASYLKITPETLSRVRQRFSKN